MISRRSQSDGRYRVVLFVNPHPQLLVVVAAAQRSVTETPAKPPEEELVQRASTRPLQTFDAGLPLKRYFYCPKDWPWAVISLSPSPPTARPLPTPAT